jgi:hypothetical protein
VVSRYCCGRTGKRFDRFSLVNSSRRVRTEPLIASRR